MQIKNVRFIIAAITTFGAYAVYVTRVNLSIAIIAMVDDHHAEEAALMSHNVNNSNQTLIGNGSTNSSQLFATPLVGGNTTSAPAGSISLTAAPNLGANSIFPTSKRLLKFPLISQDKFDWDQTEQGHILGAFFYGYILFQIPGARIAESVGAKWILLAGIFNSAVISLVFPLSTQLNSLQLLMFLRFLMGLSQSAFFPAAYVLFCRWLPERERSILLPIMFIGSNVGSISTYIMSSYLISSSYGWPSVFYLSGFICLIVSLLYLIFVSSEPTDNWLITEEECQLIRNNVNNQSSESNSLNEQSSNSVESLDYEKFNEQYIISNKGDNKCLENGNHLKLPGKSENGLDLIRSATRDPASTLDFEVGQQQKQLNLGKSVEKVKSGGRQPDWSKLLKSIPIWTLVLSMYGNEWSNVVICYELPTYLSTALNYPIEQNGLINSFFQLSYALASPIMSSLGAYMLDNHIFGMRKIHVRKLFQSFATFGQMVCFVSVPICGANKGLIIMFMFAAYIFKSCANAGDIMVSGDLSPEYAGTLFAFANSIGNTAGVFMPLLAGVLVTDPYEREQWRPFWWTTALIMGLSGFIFLIFGVTKRQEFGNGPETNLADQLSGDFEITSSSEEGDVEKFEKNLISISNSQAPPIGRSIK